MLSITVSSLVTFALTAGLVGPYVFLAMFICFCISYAVETCTTRKKVAVSEEDPEDEEAASPTNEEESFTLISALSSIWIPCVVGDQPQGVAHDVQDLPHPWFPPRGPESCRVRGGQKLFHRVGQYWGLDFNDGHFFITMGW